MLVAVPVTTLILTTTSAPAAEKPEPVGAAATVSVVNDNASAAPVHLSQGRLDKGRGSRGPARARPRPRRIVSVRSRTTKWFAKQYMQQKYGWGADQFAALEQLWQHESGWSQAAHNSSSGAHGIPQALPGSKMGMFGADWATNPERRSSGACTTSRRDTVARRVRGSSGIRTTGTEGSDLSVGPKRSQHGRLNPASALDLGVHALDLGIGVRPWA